MTWQPTISFETLKARAAILKRIREFFDARDILEVETPSLSHYAVTDPHLHSLPVTLPELKQKGFLQTSPEFAMKRLLAAGSGSIFQICRSFRDGEAGAHHNPEFTMLEWYRIGFTHLDLMNEMGDFLKFILSCEAADRYTYQEIFEKILKFNPHTIALSDLQAAAERFGIREVSSLNLNDRDVLLQWLMTHAIEPVFAKHKPTFIYDYPASQAMLARIRKEPFPIGERFEVYWGSLELANGFYELANADEQRARFLANNEMRKKINYSEMALDENFLAALSKGLPNCAGVALGIDRLIMIALQKTNIQEVLSFPWERA